MSIFTQPFLSVAGQKERLTNVVNTIGASLTGKGVQANTSNPTVNKVLSYAASNPYTTAAVVTPLNTIGAAKAGFSSLSTGGKVIAAVSTPIVVSAAITNPKVISSAGQIPKDISSIGSIKTKEDFLNFASENPFITGGAALAGGLVLGKSIAGAGTSIANTLAIKDQTNTLKKIAQEELINITPTKQNEQISDSKLTSTSLATPLPLSSSGGAVPEVITSVGNKDVKTYTKRKKAKSLYRSPVTVNNKIMFYNKNG